MLLIKKISLRLEKFYISVISAIFGIEHATKLLKKCSPELITFLLKKYKANIKQNTTFKGGLIIDNSIEDIDSTNTFENIIIGENCFIGKNVFLDLANKIILEDEVIISARVNILTHSDCGNRKMNNYYKRKSAPTRIGSGSWIGIGATILVGISIGENCVVGAGSVVTKDVPSGSVVAGVPAKEIKKLKFLINN